MNNNMMPMQNFPMEMPQQSIEHLYPEVYRGMQPFAANTIDGYLRRSNGADLTEEELNRMADDIVARSGMEMDGGMAPEAVAVQRGFGRRRDHHNRDTLSDIARILLLRELYDRRRNNYPYFVFPFRPY